MEIKDKREKEEVPSGIRLMLLLKERLVEIMDRERANQNSIHLYCTGPYWVAFECSAYQLYRAFPDSELAPLVRPQTYLEKRRVGLQAIDRPRIFLGRLP